VFAASVVFSGTQLGIKGAEDNKDDKKDEKKEVVINNEKKGSYDKKLKKIDPQESNFVQQALNEYWPVLAVGLTELETYRGVPKLQGSEARSTNGLGVTYTYYYNEKGILYRVANPKNAEKVRTFDVAGNYEQCKRHLTYETLPKLGNAIKRKENITAQQSVALVLAGYQRPSDMDNIALRLSKAKTKQEIADAFAYYPGSTKYKEGTLKRRWWCAAYATGVITMQDFIDLPRDGFSNIELSNVYKDGHFVLTNEAVQYELKTAKTGKRSTVKDFLNSFETGQEILNDVNSVSSKTVALDEAARQIRKQNARGDLLYGVEKTLV
jgi:hypothetical protein